MTASGLMKINFFTEYCDLSLSKSITVFAFFNEPFESNNGIFSFTIPVLILHLLSTITTGNIKLFLI